MKCPSCSAEAAGKFCHNCGAALAGATCASCHAGLTAGARFCHVCGNPVAGRRAASGVMPWVIAGAAVVVLIVVAILRLAPAGNAAAPTPAGLATTGQAADPSQGAAPDISNLSPRERADRLFDRIMTAGEQGDTARMRFFEPMAIQAYALLGAPDDHINYDVGMIYAVLGEADSALSRAAAIEHHTPDNLLAIMVRIAVASGRKDQATLRGLYTTFLAKFDKEVAAARPGYDEHRTALDGIKAEAERVLGKH